MGSAIHYVVAFGQLGKRSRDLLGRGLHVIIQGDDDRVFRQANSAEQRVVLTVVAHQIETANPRIPDCKFLDDGPTPVAAFVVNEDQLA